MQRWCAGVIPRAVLVLLALVGLACGSAVAQNPGSTGKNAHGAEGGSPQHAAPAHAGVPDGAPSESALESPAPTDVDLEAKWKEVQSQYPEAIEYRPAQTAQVPLEELLSWVPAGKTGAVYDRACRPIRVERRGRELLGIANERTDVQGDTKSVTWTDVSFGERIVAKGNSVEPYHRGPDGHWISEGIGGINATTRVGVQLSKVTQDAAWYNGELVRLSVGCSKLVESVVACTGGGTLKCMTCEWRLYAESLEEGLGKHRPRPAANEAVAVVGRVGCDVTCPSRALLDGVQRTDESLQSRNFLAVGPFEHPFLFRTRAACSEYRRRHAIPADQLSSW